MLSEVRFGSFLAYSPRGTSDTSQHSRRVCHGIKTDGVIGQPPVRLIEYAIRRLKEEITEGDLYDLIAPDIALIPCPRSAPFPPGQKPALWIPMRICEALSRAGYASTILPCVERIEAVQKSAFAERGSRPSLLRHLETLRVNRPIERPRRITLVDDVITKGATLLAAASLVASAFPDAEVRAFALIRTMGLVSDVEQILDPVVGRIARTAADTADRQP